MDDERDADERPRTARTLGIAATTAVALLLLFLFGLPHLDTAGVRRAFSVATPTPRPSSLRPARTPATPVPVGAAAAAFADYTEFILVDSMGQAAVTRQDLDQLNDDRARMGLPDLRAVIVVIPRDPAVPPSVLPAPTGTQPIVVDLRPSP